MNIQLDTKHITPDEARGLIAFLTTLLPVNSENNLTPQTPEAPTLQTAIDSTTEAAELGPAAADPVPPATTEHLAKRTRRTKEQIAADEAAKADRPPTTGDQLAAAEAARKEAASQQAVVAPNGSTKIDADQLRGLLNGYIARHSMEEAIEKLRAFGCNRVTEALALESAKLNELAATLNG
jgi:hypothetical protein